MPKKLKTVVKSLYSHEIRKDVSLEQLRSLKLEEAWPFIRDEIEAEIGSAQLVCIPHVTEAELYRATALFVQDPKESSKTLVPVGQLRDVVAAPRCDPALLQLLEDKQQLCDATFKFPHESVKITLQDEGIKNKVRVIMVNFTRAAAPADLPARHTLHLDRAKHPALREARSVHMISSVLMAGTLEFRVTRGPCSRIFHLGTPTPLLFALDEFLLDGDGKLHAKAPVSVKSRGLRWRRMDSADHLYTTDEADAALYQ